jgi:hypothetical protein
MITSKLRTFLDVWNGVCRPTWLLIWRKTSPFAARLSPSRSKARRKCKASLKLPSVIVEIQQRLAPLFGIPPLSLVEGTATH